MSVPSPAGVDKCRVAPMRIAQRTRKAGDVVWHEDKMNVIGHEAIGPHPDRRFATVLGKKIAIDFLVAGLEENGFAPIAALRNVMRTSGDDDASEASHDANIPPLESCA